MDPLRDRVPLNSSRLRAVIGNTAIPAAERRTLAWAERDRMSVPSTQPSSEGVEGTPSGMAWLLFPRTVSGAGGTGGAGQRPVGHRQIEPSLVLIAAVLITGGAVVRAVDRSSRVPGASGGESGAAVPPAWGRGLAPNGERAARRGPVGRKTSRGDDWARRPWPVPPPGRRVEPAALVLGCARQVTSAELTVVLTPGNISGVDERRGGALFKGPAVLRLRPRRGRGRGPLALMSPLPGAHGPTPTSAAFACRREAVDQG